MRRKGDSEKGRWGGEEIRGWGEKEKRYGKLMPDMLNCPTCPKGKIIRSI
jgi:hypothetical protein